MEKNYSDNENVIVVKGITKTFGNVVANKNIDFSVRKGEIHALLGENGSGKTTLMNMLSGIYSPDSGSIFVNGENVIFKSPKDSIDKGIGMIYQHFKLIDVFTATENIVLGQKNSIKVNNKKLKNEIIEISKKYGLTINPDKKVYDMSVGEKQTVEILKVLYRGARILILDEPTAVLTPQETKNLFKILRKMSADGCSIIIITHKLHEVMEISDRVTILRKGESIATLNIKDTNPQELTEVMVGKAVDLSIKKVDATLQGTYLKIENLTVINDDKVKVLNDISFELCGGEILGVAGIAGSGQKELCESIAGLYPVESGTILFKGDNIVGKSPREIIKMGISMSFIPEDRLGMGLVGNMSMVDNVILKGYQNQRGPFIDRTPAKELSLKLVEGLSIDTPGINYPVRLLSGGNVQKVLLGREIESNPQLLITAYPVRGLDINSSYTIYDLINEQKAKGVAVLYIGEDLDVLLELSDRIMVLSDGNLMDIVNADEVTKDDVGLMMAGNSTIFTGEV